MTDQTLNTFYRVATERGFSRDYQARVSQLVINGQALGDDDLVYLKSMSLPSKKAAISTVKYFGVEIHSTGVRDYGDSKNWELTFLTDQILYLKQWFEQRLEEVADNTDNPGRLNVSPVPGLDSYAVIDVLDDNLETVASYTLNGLFVVSTPGIAYDLSGAGKVQEFKVTLGYQTWGVTPGSIPQYESPGGAGALGNVLNTLRTVNSIVRNVKSISKAIRKK